MRDDCPRSWYLYLNGRIGHQLMLKAVRRDVARHGDISLELCLSVEFLHVEKSVFAEAAPLHLLLLALRLLRLELLHRLLLIYLLQDFLADGLVAEPASHALDGILHRRPFRRCFVAA